MKKVLASVVWLLGSGVAGAQVPTAQVPIHDPVLVQQNGTTYLFATGPGIAVWASHDGGQTWTTQPPVFAQPPTWAAPVVPGFRDHIWAPDISFADGQYSLFYSISTFGKNRSAIGLATNRTLDPKSPAFQWVDHGPVLTSVPGRDNWNAIDPNLVRDEAGQPWLAFGSFWGGLKLVRLRPDLTAPAEPQEWHALASRPGAGAIEAPFLFRRAGYYYLFAFIDYCCQGPKSTYKVVVGRSRALTGPYLDAAGRALTEGGGTLVVQGDSTRWYGAGHSATVSLGGTDYLVFHGYDARDQGRSKLRLEPLAWSAEGWPTIAAAP